MAMASRVWLGDDVSVPVRCRRLRLGPCLQPWKHSSLRTTAGVCLDGGARHRAIGTEYATIARERLEALTTSFAVIEKLACVHRHGFCGMMSTPRTGQRRFRDQVWLFIHSCAAKLASNISTRR